MSKGGIERSFFTDYYMAQKAMYSKVSYKRTVSNNRTAWWHCFTKSLKSALPIP